MNVTIKSVTVHATQATVNGPDCTQARLSSLYQSVSS